MQQLGRNVKTRFGTAFLLLATWNLVASHLFIREANNTLRLPQNPQSPTLSYSVNDAFPGLMFEKPVGFAVEPGETNRLFVLERAGRIIVITNLSNPTRTVFMDVTNRIYSDFDSGYAEGLSSVAFHPGYATNRYFYATYTLRSNVGGIWQNYNRITRYQRSQTNKNQGDTASELSLITQFDQGDGHNFNSLHFGADGYLYCAAGDEGDGGTGDDFNNAQRIDKDFFSAILRIDVDKRPGSLNPNPHLSATTNYAIPPDNPFIGATTFNGAPVSPTNVRTEFWAVGFRNPWRIAFDPATGFLYGGDVGQYDREEIDVIVKGGNYGWAYRQGTMTGPKGSPPAGVTLKNPIVEYSHGFGTNQGNCIIGGVVYRGLRIPDLYGAYIFADYVSGNIWSLRYDGTNATPFTRLTGQTGIAGFGADPRNGDILMADVTGGKILRLDYTTTSAGNIPQTLAETGAFADLATLTENPGIVPYDINVSFWSDNAKKRRWFSLPDSNLKFVFNPDGNWSFPATTVWIKHFDLELTNGFPQSTRRIETRFLVKNENGVYGLTYRWNGLTTNATLVPETGMDELFLINDGGTIRTQVWHYPSRTECLVCHTAVAGQALGFNTAQMNRDFDYGIVTNQLYALSDAGYFASTVTNLYSLRALSHATNSSISREYRVRSYLAANCAQCHQPGGSAQAYWDARITTPLSQANIVNGSLFNYAGNPGNRVIKPGSPIDSMLYTRIANLGSMHMPPLATSILNTQAIDLVRAWITNDLVGYKTFSEWQLSYFGSTNTADAVADADPDHDKTSNYLEYLLGRNPTNPADGWKLTLQKTNSQVALTFFQTANRGFQVETTTNLNPPVSWMTLDAPENRPFFSINNRTNGIQGSISKRNFYRVKIFEP